MSNLLSEAVKEQLRMSGAPPYHFYLMQQEEYENFIATEEVTSYENMLANSMYNTELDFSSVYKARANVKIVVLKALETLLSQEQNMLNDISGFEKMNGIPIPEIPKAEDVYKNFNKMEQYYKNFNFYIQSLFLNQKLDTDKNKNIQWHKVKGEDSYDYFLFLLQQISRQGGFWVKQGVGIEKSKVFKTLQSIINDPNAETNVDIKTINLNLDSYFKALKLEGNAEKKFKDDLMDMWKQRMSSEKKDLSSWESDYFYTILLPPMIAKIMATHNLKDIAGDKMNILKERKYWDLFYNDLIKSGFTLIELTFLKTTEDTFLQYAFKGDYGEMVQAVLGIHQGIETKYMGSKTANEETDKGEQSYIDTLITINNHKYGIQDKEYSFVKKNGINTRVYGGKNFEINFKDVNLLSYFDTKGIKILGALLELYNDDSIDKMRIESLMAHLDLEQIRAVGYMGFEPKPIEDLGIDDIVYSLIYRITGQYYPASYILAQRLEDIKKQNSVYVDEKSKSKNKQARSHYKIKSFNEDSRNNLLATERYVDADGNTKLKNLDIHTAEEIVKLLIITATMK